MAEERVKNFQLQQKSQFNQVENQEGVRQLENSWDRVYWFLRMLISNDKYVAVGKESQLIAKITSSLRLIAKDNRSAAESDILALQFNASR